MFKIIVYIFGLLACSLGFILPDKKYEQVPLLDGRIVGGSSTDIAVYPYSTSVLFFNFHHCGGSIIAKNWIMTAAHCVINVPVSVFSFRVGSSIRNSGGTVVTASNIYLHAFYSEITLNYDIAVALLRNNLVFQTGIQPVPLVQENANIPVGTIASVTGWGMLAENGIMGNQLQIVFVPIVDQEVCKEAYATLNRVVLDSMICAGYRLGGHDACQGDSGGALVTHHGQVGIVSWGYGCARPNFYGVYANVQYLRNWIYLVTGV